MKKVGILTINDYSNYGNRLQNYASQEVIKSLNYDVKTVVNLTKPKVNKIDVKLGIKERINRIISMPIYEQYEIIKNKINQKLNSNKIDEAKKNKEIKFKQFTKENIIETDYYITDELIPSELNHMFDFFVTGSDQVWNPLYRTGSSIDFLTFASKEKRISYSPSFGISSIPDEYVDKYKLWLNEMEYLSVREDAGAKIIKELTGKDATVLLDPTMMLTKEQWISISKQSEYKPKNGYILTYFLGKIGINYKKMINKTAKENNLEIVNLGSLNDLNRYSADPSEFIDYINSSTVFFTDSFHGAVFSILLEKPFVVCDRIENGVSMMSRIDTLLNKFKLSSRKWSNIKDNNEIFNIDYSHTKSIIAIEKEKTLNYLKVALGTSND